MLTDRQTTDRQTDDGRQGDLITSARELAELKMKKTFLNIPKDMFISNFKIIRPMVAE